MTVTTDFDSEFIVPGFTYQAKGKLKVYDWAKARVIVDKQVCPSLIEVKCTRVSGMSGAGSATLSILDPDKEFFNTIDDGSEVEIYMSEQTPMTYGNKVWGGFLQNKEFDVTKKVILKLQAKEYMFDLTDKYTPDALTPNENSFTTTEPGEIIKTLMATYQLEFTTDNVITGTGSTMSVSFKKKTLFECIKQICDTFNYVFYINLDKDLVVRRRYTQVNTAISDYATWGDNIISIKDETTQEYLTNTIYVVGVSSSVKATAVDATSVAQYGEHTLNYVAPALTTNTDCQNFADAYIALFKDPIQSIKIKSKLLAFSSPYEYIQVNSERSGLSGSYQIVQMTHEYSKKGLYTELTLSNKITDLSTSLGQLMSRLSQVETTTYG